MKRHFFDIDKQIMIYYNTELLAKLISNFKEGVFIINKKSKIRKIISTVVAVSSLVFSNTFLSHGMDSSDSIKTAINDINSEYMVVLTPENVNELLPSDALASLNEEAKECELPFDDYLKKYQLIYFMNPSDIDLEGLLVECDKLDKSRICSPLLGICFKSNISGEHYHRFSNSETNSIKVKEILNLTKCYYVIETQTPIFDYFSGGFVENIVYDSSRIAPGVYFLSIGSKSNLDCNALEPTREDLLFKSYVERRIKKFLVFEDGEGNAKLFLHVNKYIVW